MRGSKESAAILLILLLAATALSSPGSFPDEHDCSNYTGVGTSGDFKVVNISEDPSFSSRVGCGLVRLSIRSDEVSQDCTISNTVRAVDLHEQTIYNATISPGNTFYTLYLLPFATTTLSGVLLDEYENPIQGATVKWTDCDDNDVVSDTTDADGKFSFMATSGSYKLKVVYNGITYLITVNGEECCPYPPGTCTIDLTISTTATLNGVLLDEYEDPIEGATVKWTDCDDNDVVSDTTDADGKFSLTATPGSYKLKVVYNGITYLITVNGEECCPYPPGTCTIDLTISTTATLTGVVQDEDGDPLEDATVKWTDCNDNYVVADITDADGRFRLTAAAAGSYKLSVRYNGIMYPFTMNGEECPYYDIGTWNLNDPLTIPITTTLHGYIKDLDNEPLHGLTVALHDCSGDLAASDDTDSSGHFSITTDAGYYEIIITVMEWYRIRILDDGESCLLLVGDADFGTLNIDPIPDCSQYNYLCYGSEMNIKLFNCYWDDGCWCFMQECPCGCTDGLPECDSCETGTVHIDVDNINNNKPQPGAKIYLDDEYQGTTDSLGKKSVNASYGGHEIRVECPGGTDCGSQELYVNGDEYPYFDCDCDTRLAALQVNVDNVNGYPVANVYVYVDGEERALTCPFGYVYIEDVPYGDRHIDIIYSITNPEHIGYYQKSLDITVDEEKEVVNFIATLPDRSQRAQAQSLGDSSNFTRIENFTPQAVFTGAAAMAVIDIASVTWSTDEFCRCMFQEEGSSGIEQCIDAITDCGGDTRGCIKAIRENAGPAANQCKFEGAMLVGDVASPFIPAGFVGHGVAAVVGEGRVLKLVDNIGESGRIIKTKAGGVVEYVKDGIARFAVWFDDLDMFKRCIVEGTKHWSDDALDGLESIAKAGGEGPEGNAVAETFVKILKDEYGDEYVQKTAEGVKEIQVREITGADKVLTKIVEAKDNLANLKGIAFEVEVATDSRYVDDVAEVRRDIPNGDIDILFKNDDIIEAKNIDWNTVDREKFNKHKTKLGDQIRKYKDYQINTLNNPDAEIKVVFKNEDSYWYPEMKAFLEDDKGVLVGVL